MASERELFVYENKKLVLQKVPVAPLGSDEVRVQPKAVAVNPTDYKHLAAELAEGAGAGCDFSGVVTEIGSSVKDVKVGDTVAGAVGGGNIDAPQDGAYTTLLTLKGDDLLKLPDLKSNSSSHIDEGVPISFEQAASLGIGVLTAAIAFAFHNDTPLKPNSRSGFSLIYGASSSLGFQAAQLARYLGYDVIAVAGKKHKDLLKSVGIERLIDYHDPDWVDAARTIGGDDIVHAYDAISDDKTFLQVYRAVSNTKPAKINLSLVVQAKPDPVKENVKVDWPLLYLIWQDRKKFGTNTVPGIPELRAQRKDISDAVNGLLKSHVFHSLPIEVAGRGFSQIPDAVERFSKGVSGEKIVVRY